jgi:membrane protein YqaA with SNARE-associated domain
MITGLSALFASAFLAATILPLSSELVLGGLAAVGEIPSLWLLVAASAGNILGACVNWLLGRFCLRWRERRWFPVSASALDRASAWFQRYGTWSLLLAWVPVVGDPLTLVAGILRVDFRLFVLLVAIGKTARYAVVLGVIDGLT